MRSPQKLVRCTKQSSNAYNLKYDAGCCDFEGSVPDATSPAGLEKSSGLGWLACVRFRLGSPRFHEPEDHADVADSLIGQRRR